MLPAKTPMVATIDASRAHRWPAAAWFALRAWGLCFRHFLRLRRREPRLIPTGGTGAFAVPIARSTSALYAADGITPTERGWQLGKVENLRRALRAIDGVVVPVGVEFSFWRQVGPPWRMRGFVVGRELREGCLIPGVGGGLCQLSNALYDCALQAGAEILERHRHTRVVPGSLAELNRDATIFWNYVDLRFRFAEAVRISARLTTDRLVVALHVAREGQERAATKSVPGGAMATAESCATCGVGGCLRHVGEGEVTGERTAVIVDEFRPEFDAWLTERRNAELAVPMRFSRWRRDAYAWTERGWDSVRDAPFVALARAHRSRRLAEQGAARQRAMLASDRRLAEALGHKFSWRCSRAVVAQNLLPHLRAPGLLGGRAVTVFLTRWPIRCLEERLDAASQRHPESPTLADFRADPALAEAEWEALEAAEALVTCHARLAEIWPHKTTLLPWDLPAGGPNGMPASAGGCVVFPASGVGRKGAYELRAALRETPFPLRILGREQLENDPQFWGELPRAGEGRDWLDGARVVVLPAWIEHRPRRLLEAIAARVPVIATDACGLHGWPADTVVKIVPAGDVAALTNALRSVVADEVIA